VKLVGGNKASLNRWGIAWVALTMALALHVADEALTGFLPLYNEIVASMQESVPWLPLPTFTFRVWLTGLTALILVLLALSPLVFRGYGWLRPVAYALGTIMVANAIGHTVASFYWRLWAPGVYSSPTLFIAAVALLVTTRRTKSTTADASDA
jgi:hypothetical protein